MLQRVCKKQQRGGSMLISRPEILAKNPDCYKVEFGKGYVPTDIATEEEKKAIAEFNRFVEAAEKQTTFEIL